ncbi:MAG: DUF5698 domain-containing protein [Candidatus Caldatribacteriota bacterium]|jgi:uncharacterized protein YebE (UPF0316 family)|nr:DUF5698 domain-containing protein [Atribacterota bacterium]MDD3031277.1 DUF5698 domain-containing protein [Atribacterota bacterium]MDD3641121.1 DUF5698 domain-containing protein [Atribacterota bacterium]MDD4289332.1 DUF5698 domain-containing protein [Atribacterota bacterium]MDD4765467.1 DUF5698 domain-containing protein [Atribacterota bacterium]
MIDIINDIQNLNPIIWALFIFLSRVVDVSLGTFRVQMIVNRKKIAAGIIGFVEILIFILVVSKVIQDIGNWMNVLAYCAGFAAGNIVGISITEKFSHDIISIGVISKDHWPEIEQRLREEGFGVTRNLGYGLQGEIQVLRIITSRNLFPKIRDIALEYDRKAFITSYLIVGKSGGYMYNVKSKI